MESSKHNNVFEEVKKLSINLNSDTQKQICFIFLQIIPRLTNITNLIDSDDLASAGFNIGQLTESINNVIGNIDKDDFEQLTSMMNFIIEHHKNQNPELAKTGEMFG